MNKIKRSGRLLKASFAVLFREKKLLLFPLIGTGLAVVVALFFFAPIALYPTGHPYTSSAHWSALADKVAHFLPMSKSHEKYGEVAAGLHPYSAMISSGTWWVAPLFALAYFTSMFLATFCNVAFYHEIMQALGGNAVSIRRGFRFAAARWRAVLLWSLFAGLVGYIINAIEERVSFLGKIITSFLGFAWSIACIFIIPTLVREEQTVNPVKLLRNSAGTLKRTWGELVIGFAGMELAFGFAVLLLVIAAMLTGGVAAFFICWYFHWSEWWILPVVLGEWFSLAVLLGLIGSVVNPVYRCALYVYATEGVVPESFDKELLDSAWKVK
jgi:hypothetical protein